ncbi:MAG: hypothetical protein KY469_19985 [Actinobacteria bacterium]|nr:hypothetical protein [Actinomycetota bacterium]
MIRNRMLAAAVAVVAFASVAADHELPARDEYVPEFVEQEAWFHAHTLPIGNLDAREGNYVQWDDQAPTGEVSAVYVGDNLGWIATNPSGGNTHDPQHFFTAEGTFTGDLESLSFDMYLHGWAQSTIGCDMSISVELLVDDLVVLSQDFTGSNGVYYNVVDDDTVVARFALTNLWKVNELYDLPYGPDVEHPVYVNLQNFYLCNEYQWRYDGVEDPSRITANVPNPAGKGYFPIDVLNPPPPVEGEAA